MPRIVLITLLGDKIYDLIPVKFMMTVVVFALLAASVVILIKYIKKKDKK